jgi:hypothetical protein
MKIDEFGFRKNKKNLQNDFGIRKKMFSNDFEFGNLFNKKISISCPIRVSI